MNWPHLLITVVILAGVFGVVALGLNLQFGHAGMINFGMVAYFAVGAYVYAILTARPPSGLDFYLYGFDLPVWVGFLGAGVGGVLFAAVTGWPSLRLRGEYLAVTTFAFAEVFTAFVSNEQRFANGTRGMVQIRVPFEDVTFLDKRTVLALLSMGLLVVTFFVFQRIVGSPYGRSLEAIRDDEIAMTTSGKDTQRFRLQVFLVSAVFVGFAGALYAWYTTVAYPDLFTAEVTFIAWIALVLGGAGWKWGAVIGIYIIVLFEELVRTIDYTSFRAAQIAASLEVAALGILLVVFLRWQPFSKLQEISRRRART